MRLFSTFFVPAGVDWSSGGNIAGFRLQASLEVTWADWEHVIEQRQHVVGRPGVGDRAPPEGRTLYGRVSSTVRVWNDDEDQYKSKRRGRTADKRGHCSKQKRGQSDACTRPERFKGVWTVDSNGVRQPRRYCRGRGPPHHTPAHAWGRQQRWSSLPSGTGGVHPAGILASRG